MKIKFLTLNVLHGGEILFDPMLDFLKKENADILALQEIQDSPTQIQDKQYHTWEILQKELDNKYSVFAPQSRITKDNVEFDHGNAVFSRFPIESERTVFFDIPYGAVDHAEMIKKDDFTQMPQNFQEVQINMNGTIVTVINVHGIWGHDGDDNPRRTLMGEMILESVIGKPNVILAGDFNLTPDTKVIAKIEKHLTNVFKGELKTSFNMKRKDKPGYATSVVDMIFTSPHIKVLSHICPSVDVSDHLPLICELEI